MVMGCLCALFTYRAFRQGEKTGVCMVARLAQPSSIDANWDKPAWGGIKAEPIRHHMGSKPEHFPKTEVKVAYDEGALHVIFRVDDRYVRALTPKYQGSVCGDSCVEFFSLPVVTCPRGTSTLR